VTSILSHSPAEVAKALVILRGQGNQPNTWGPWPTYVSSQPDKPDNILFLLDIGSPLSGRNHVTGATLVHYTVEFNVRGVRGPSTGTGGYTSAWEKIGLICNMLDSSVLNTQVTVGGFAYTIHAATRLGDISSQGPDQTNRERYLFSTPYALAITQH